MTFPESTFWYCSTDTVPFARAESTGSENVFAHIPPSSRPERTRRIRNRHPTHLAMAM